MLLLRLLFPSLCWLLPDLHEDSSKRAVRPRHPNLHGHAAARWSSQMARPPTRTAAPHLTGWRPDRHLPHLPLPLAGSSRRTWAPSPGSSQRRRAVGPHRLPITANPRPPCRRSRALLPRTSRHQSRRGTRRRVRVSLTCIWGCTTSKPWRTRWARCQRTARKAAAAAHRRGKARANCPGIRF